ncbi:hypothetical protein T11_13507 [Trichinella zimbabwensis]|nr:hypothetical protein T11_13507 [Trichinella zimbabwensis]
MDNCGNSRANTRTKTSTEMVEVLLLEQKPNGVWLMLNVETLCTGDITFKCLPYQPSMVVYATTMVITGNGESGFDSGEGA